MTAKLIVTSGANRGAQFALADRIIFNIGSDRSSTVFLDDPKVSPNHCRLYKEDSKYTLFDVSGKGLAVNGKKVVKAVLAEGDVVQIGDTEIRFTAADAPGGFGGPPAPGGAAAPGGWGQAPGGYPEGAHAGAAPGGGGEPRGYSRVWLQCVEGNDKGKTFDLSEGNVWVIGRGHSADITVMDIKVSRAHTRIDRQGNTFYINDLNSTNGSFLNGQQIDRQVLHRGDYIKVGYTILSFQYEELPEPAHAPAAGPGHYSHAPHPPAPSRHPEPPPHAAHAPAGWGPPPQAGPGWGAPPPPPQHAPPQHAPPQGSAGQPSWAPPPPAPIPSPSALMHEATAPAPWTVQGGAGGPPGAAPSGPTSLREGADAESDYRFKSFLSYEEVDSRVDDRERLAGISSQRAEPPRLPFETGAQPPPAPPGGGMPPHAPPGAPPAPDRRWAAAGPGSTAPAQMYAAPPPMAPPGAPGFAPPAASPHPAGAHEEEDVPLDIAALDDDDFGTGSRPSAPPAPAFAPPGGPAAWGAPVAAASLPATPDAWGAPPSRPPGAGGHPAPPPLPPPPQRPGAPAAAPQRTTQLPAWNDGGAAGGPPSPPPWGSAAPPPAYGAPEAAGTLPPPPQRNIPKRTTDMMVPDLDDDDLFGGPPGPAAPAPGAWGAAPPAPAAWGAQPPPAPAAWGAPPAGGGAPAVEARPRHKTGELPVSDYLVRGGPAPPPISSEANAPLACFLCHRPFSQDDMRQNRLRRIKDHYYCLHCVQES